MTPRLSVQKDRLKFVLLEGIHRSAADALAADGYTTVDARPGALAGDALLEAIADAHFLGIRSRTQLTESVLEAAPKLVAVGAFCIGTNQVDLDAAARRGVPVFNAPFSNTRSVAELVLAEAVMLLRGIPQKNALLHRGGWTKSAAGSYEARGKVLGIVGYGHIGTQIGVLAEQLGLSVVFCDVETKLPLGNARQLGSLDEVCWLLNVRGEDVPHCPVLQSFALVHAAGAGGAGVTATLFVDEMKVAADVRAALAAAGQSEAAHLVQQLGGEPAARPWSRPDRVLLAPEQRRTLISLLDDTHSSAVGKNEDVQVTVTADRLEGLLGAETVRLLAAAFGKHVYDTIKLRRVEAHGLCVPFHTDYSRYYSRCWIYRMCILAIPKPGMANIPGTHKYGCAVDVQYT
jgi:hypothetical protein